MAPNKTESVLTYYAVSYFWLFWEEWALWATWAIPQETLDIWHPPSTKMENSASTTTQATKKYTFHISIKTIQTSVSSVWKSAPRAIPPRFNVKQPLLWRIAMNLKPMPPKLLWACAIPMRISSSRSSISINIWMFLPCRNISLIWRMDGPWFWPVSVYLWYYLLYLLCLLGFVLDALSGWLFCYSWLSSW